MLHVMSREWWGKSQNIQKLLFLCQDSKLLPQTKVPDFIGNVSVSVCVHSTNTNTLYVAFLLQQATLYPWLQPGNSEGEDLALGPFVRMDAI